MSVAAHDRIVNDNQALACNHGFERVQLESNTQLANGLRRLNEGTPHIGVLDQAVTVRNAGLLGVADGRRDAGFWRGHHQICFDLVFTGELAPHFHAGFVDRAPRNRGIRASQVDVFEDASGGFCLSKTV